MNHETITTGSISSLVVKHWLDVSRDTNQSWKQKNVVVTCLLTLCYMKSIGFLKRNKKENFAKE